MNQGGGLDFDRVAGVVNALVRVSRFLESTDSGLSFPQYRMLSQLRAGGVPSAKVAEALRVRKPTITAVADGLVAAGLASRERAADDRRVVRLEITDTGRATLDKADRAYVERLEPVLIELDDPERFIDDVMQIKEVLDARARAHQAQ